MPCFATLTLVPARQVMTLTLTIEVGKAALTCVDTASAPNAEIFFRFFDAFASITVVKGLP
jgi:hypothetical protein